MLGRQIKHLYFDARVLEGHATRAAEYAAGNGEIMDVRDDSVAKIRRGCAPFAATARRLRAADRGWPADIQQLDLASGRFGSLRFTSVHSDPHPFVKKGITQRPSSQSSSDAHSS